VSCLAAQKSVDVPIELVVSDFAFDDWPLVEWIEDSAAEMPIRVISLHEGFSSGVGLNMAVARSRSDRLLMCDADILNFPAALRRAIDVIDSNQAWFPILRCLEEDGTPVAGGSRLWRRWGESPRVQCRGRST
jgi:glycosyltransferase involved in cell wall biosynthesis